MATQVGSYLISSVGRMLDGHGKLQEIGFDREYETFVFRCTRGRCVCGCGMPTFRANEIDALSAHSAKDAAANHMKLCRKWARGGDRGL
jgi:hypothetical protein